MTLFLENNPHPLSSFGGGILSHFVQNPFEKMPSIARYVERNVEIEGLNPRWRARVDPFNGSIYFFDTLTGMRQQAVPPGFADLISMSRNESMELFARQVEATFGAVDGDADINLASSSEQNIFGHVFGTDSELLRPLSEPSMDEASTLQAKPTSTSNYKLQPDCIR